MFLKNRGYLVDPDPTLPEVKEAYKAGAITHFARHSRLGYTAYSSAEQVEKNFRAEVAYLRKLGFRSISLKTGAYGMEALAPGPQAGGRLQARLAHRGRRGRRHGHEPPGT